MMSEFSFVSLIAKLNPDILLVLCNHFFIYGLYRFQRKDNKGKHITSVFIQAMVYSDELRDLFKKQTEVNIEQLRSLQEMIQLWETLHHWRDDGTLFCRSFMETDFDKYASFRRSKCIENDTESLDSISYYHNRMTCGTEEDAKYEHAEYVESKLKQIPFENAVRYANPEYRNTSNPDILQCLFNGPVEWRDNPGSILYMTSDEREQVLKQFEYMCYYVINTRDELEFDIGQFLSEATNVGIERFSGETTSVPAKREQAEFRSEDRELLALSSA